ncbi:MAG: class I SAM-dependent methyltransferase [Caldilineaceae bacterium]
MAPDDAAPFRGGAWTPALAQVPSPGTRRLALRVTAAAERTLRSGHPWLFDGAITEQSKDGAPGDLAVIFDLRPLPGRGPLRSTARARPSRAFSNTTTRQPSTLPFCAAYPRAVARRAALAATANDPVAGTNGYRLIHGENDALPGLVVDRYAETLVLRLDTPAWVPHLATVLPRWWTPQPADRVILRMSRSGMLTCPQLHGLEDGMALLGAPPDGPVLFRENGLIFEADPVHGQKTGFFLDQRENRQRVGDLAQGRRVLNVFAYNGGFSLYAARGGAPAVTSLDISAGALAAAVRNFAHNRHIPAVAAAHHHTLAADAFAALADLHRDGHRYEMVIIDPPAFAKRQSEVENALAAYARLVDLGLHVLTPGGILVMASCSSRVPADRFFGVVNAAARDAGRPLHELMRTGHAPGSSGRVRGGCMLRPVFAEA